jgi:RNA polymerase sigma-70 factor (ECF subfamily)
MDRSPDAALLEAWRAGDRDAADELLRRYFFGVYRFFASHRGVDAEELTQRAFEICIAARDRVHEEFGAYLYGVARNLLRREWERKAAGVELVSPSQTPLRALGTSPSMRVAKLDEQQLFARAVAALPPEFAGAIALFYWDDRTLVEIAAQLCVAVGTVKSRLSRGRALLRAWLDAAAADERVRQGALSLVDREPPA